MDRRVFAQLLGVTNVSMVWLMAVSISWATPCDLPALSPKYEIGETWIFQNAKHQRRMVSVVGFEGGLVAMRHGEPPGPPVGDTWYFNADRILLKIQKTDGLTLGKPARRYQTGGAHEGDFPLYLGKTWQYRDVATAEGKLTTFVHAYRVIGCENVKTPAGSFSAFKITYTQTNQRHRTWGERTLWYAPSVKYQIRAQTLTESRRGFWSAAVLNEELIEYRRPWMGDNTPRPELRTSYYVPSPQLFTPAPTLLSAGHETFENPSASKPSGDPWLGVPLAAADGQMMKQLGLRPNQGVLVLPFRQNPNLPVVDLDPGDLILDIDGVEIEGLEHVTSLLASKQAGAIVKVRAFRGQYQRQVDQPMVLLQGQL